MAGNCGSTCPVPEGFYSYQPSVSGNSTFIAIYALMLLATLFLGFWYGTWAYSALLGTSCLLQTVAFIGRVLLHHARDSQRYFLLFLLGTFLAPTFAASAIASTLLKLTSIVGISRPCGFSAFYVVLQILLVAVLGLEVAGAVLLCYGRKVSQNCTIFIITGLGIQTLSLVLMFGTCAVTQYPDKGIRRLVFQEGRRQMNRGLQVAGVLLFTHSVYRIVEICLSVSGTLFQGELAFMLANGALPLVSCVLLITFHPKKIDRSPAALTSSWSGKRKERPPPLTHGNAHPAHHGNSPNIALQISPTSPKSQSSNPPAVPSGSPGLPVNPRPTHQSISFQPVRAPAQASVNHYKNKKDDRQPRELVETDSLW